MRTFIRVDKDVMYPLLSGWLHHTWPEPKKPHTMTETPVSVVGVILDYAKQLERINPTICSVYEVPA